MLRVKAEPAGKFDSADVDWKDVHASFSGSTLSAGHSAAPAFTCSASILTWDGRHQTEAGQAASSTGSLASMQPHIHHTQASLPELRAPMGSSSQERAGCQQPSHPLAYHERVQVQPMQRAQSRAIGDWDAIDDVHDDDRGLCLRLHVGCP